MRVCKTPFLGGKRIVCQTCNHSHYIYFSCDHSHCPICQSIRREPWIDKLRRDLYAVPYVHVIFTLPYELHGLARSNPKAIYSLIMRASWQALKLTTAAPSNVGALPGMISVLHTFGSDMKYHVHVHSLVTFGGIDTDGRWVYPQRRSKLYRYREICAVYKEQFMVGLKRLYASGQIVYHMTYEEVESLVVSKRWVVHNTHPTANTATLETYLARYINRVAISNSRLQYLKEQEQVRITYNDYRRQQKGQAAPKALKPLSPLVAIHQIMQHVLPAYLQKTRRYGIHHPTTRKRLSTALVDLVRQNGHTIRTIMQIIKDLMGVEQIVCEQCGGIDFSTVLIPADKSYLATYLTHQNRSP